MEEKNQGPVKIYSSKKRGIKKDAYAKLLYWTKFAKEGGEKMNKLQLKRRVLGLRAMQVANQLGISQTYYTNIETGFARPKNTEIYRRIAKVVGLKPEELFEEVKPEDIG